MGLRSRLANLTKVFGNAEPSDIQAGEAAAQMTPTSPFSPGEPIGPYDGYGTTPRTRNFVTGVNINARPRSNERVSFETLKGLVQAYDVAQMAIWHRIDSIRSLDWSLIAADGFGGDVTEAIPVGMAALRKPDRQLSFEQWLASYLYDILAYDAGTLYRMRNRAGRAVGLRVVDGTSFVPLQDYWGNPPEYPAPAYVQYANGLPWNWQTTRDVIYQPFRKKADTPYGLAPLETILLNANTDLRFQAYFLQRFTDGNIPQAFASAPESWTPQQIEDWQTLWDTTLLGDQSIKSQIKWMPGGSKIEWSNEKEFQEHFSLFLMRKTAAAFHVVPADLGFTETVNKSSGESQADVQHRVGDLPLIRHIQGILTAFLQDDLGLPIRFAFDLGEEQADRLEQAQADKIYLELGVIGASDIREMRYGLPEPDGQPVPRFIYTSHAGPIPLASLYGVSGTVDPATAAPVPGSELPHMVFGGAEGVQPSPPIRNVPLAEQIYGEQAMPPAPPPQPVEAPEPDQPAEPVAKDGPTAGITAATGITSYDLAGHHRDEDEDEEEKKDDLAELAKRELAAFRSFRKARQRAGRWRDFEFRTVDPIHARRLNQGGRLAVRKAAGEVSVAGLAVRAADTGRVLMLQRCLDPEDPAGGTWEIPGGHLEDGESPLRGAWREWAEEVRMAPPPGVCTGEWTSPDGVYRGIVWTVESEDCVPIGGDREITNPDDPDGDCVEAVAWWSPEQLDGNPAVRPELLANLPDVLAALGCETPDELEKAAAGKGDAPAKRADHWPGWDADLHAANHWAEVIAAALAGALALRQAEQWAAAWLAEQQPPEGEPDKAELAEAAAIWLAGHGLDLAPALAGVLPGLYTDGYLVGLTSAHAAASGKRAKRNGWKPGDTEGAQRTIAENDAGDGLTPLLDTVPETAAGIADTRRRDLARELAKGLIAGATAAAIGRALIGALESTASALAVAITEITRSSGLAALYGYRQMGVTQGRWVLDPGSHTCPACIGNAAAGPLPLGSPYPGGSAYPPQHTRCRCSVLPA